MGRRKKSKLQPPQHKSIGQTCQEVIWMKFSGSCGIFWPVQVVNQTEEMVKIFVKSDNAQFEVKKQDKNILPFYENFDRLKTLGNGSDFRLYECLAQHCEEADLSYLQRVTATTLRKYMATITQALDLKPHQIEWVVRHMGHSLDVHKIYYRSTSDIIERTQVAKILLLQDTGRLDEFANQSFEDIQLSDLAEESTPEDVPMGELFIASEEMDEDIHDSLDPTETGQPAKKTNSAVTRKIWTTEEEEEIRQLFNKNFEERKRPTPAQCLKAIRKSKNNGV